MLPGPTLHERLNTVLRRRGSPTEWGIQASAERVKHYTKWLLRFLAEVKERRLQMRPQNWRRGFKD